MYRQIPFNEVAAGFFQFHRSEVGLGNDVIVPIALSASCYLLDGFLYSA